MAWEVFGQKFDVVTKTKDLNPYNFIHQKI